MVSAKKKLAHVLTTLMIVSACFSSAYANDERYLESDPININGYVRDEVPVSDAELENVKNELNKQKSAIIINKEKKKKYNQLSRSTEKLADVTEEMIEERKESQETIDKFNKKIDCLMAEGKKPGCEEYAKGDSVKVTQAAPKVEATTNKEYDFGQEIKILPYTGLTTFMSDNENLEAGMVAGVRAESNVSPRFSVGIAFNYTNLKTTDFGSNGLTDPGYINWYTSFYQGREIQLRNMKFDLYSKFFFVDTQRFRPYVGAGVGYNRTTINYSDNRSAGNFCSPSIYNNCAGAFNNYQYGNEEVATSNMSVDLMLGSEIRFTESIGANLEFNYTTALGSNLSSENSLQAFKAPDQRRLEDLSDELRDAHIMSLFAGMMIFF